MQDNRWLFFDLGNTLISEEAAWESRIQQLVRSLERHGRRCSIEPSGEHPRSLGYALPARCGRQEALDLAAIPVVCRLSFVRGRHKSVSRGTRRRRRSAGRLKGGKLARGLVAPQVLRKDQPAAALVSCTVTFGAANRIWLAAKASIRRRNA